MCGRFAASAPSNRLVDRFGLDDVATEAADIVPSWNVAPSATIRAILCRDGRKRLEALRWGLVPSWSKSVSGGAKMINARVESLTVSASYRTALTRRRAVIPMDGFYEWRREPGGAPQPFYYSGSDGEPLAVAGLWDAWRSPSGEGPWLVSATIITAAANDLVAQVHSRMPVILPLHMVDEWLEVGSDDSGRAIELLAAGAEQVALEARPVGRAVNSVANDSADLVKLCDPDPVQSEGPDFSLRG